MNISSAPLDITQQKLNILVADDNESDLLLIGKFVSALGHTPLLARNGVEAVTQFECAAPDMVLMDVSMPVMGGYQAAMKIREISQHHWVPIIFISVKTGEAEQARGLGIGGDDYLPKPLNLLLLEAKINVMRRIAGMQRQLEENTQQLRAYQKNAEEEQRTAYALMKRMIHTESLNDPALRYWISPATRFCGDAIAATRSRNNNLYVILADASGHGLPAALNLLPVIQVFYGMADKGFSLATIAEEMNRRLSDITPTGRFISTVLACFNCREETIEVWNGGNPGAVLLSTAGEILHQFAPQHLPLGILDQKMFDHRTEIFRCKTSCQLIIYSDGLLEIENNEGTPFGEERFLQILTSVPAKPRFASLISEVRKHMGDNTARDDISMVMIDCAQLHYSPQLEERTPRPATNHNSPWRCQLTIGAAVAKTLDLTPLLFHHLEAVEIGGFQCDQIVLIITELYNNALDHGLLQLDSSIKARPDGFTQYLALRQEMLGNLHHGKIETQVEQLTIDGQQILRIHVKDSGPGFDFRPHLDRDISHNVQPYGRGISLVKGLCKNISFVGNGNEVIVDYAL